MLYTSQNFFLFFPIVCLFYYIIPQKIRWLWILITSYFFYFSWNQKLPLLLLFSTITTYIGGIGIQYVKKRVERPRKFGQKMILFSCFSLNIGILFFYKYLDFFFLNLNKVLSRIHFTQVENPFSFILPLGISFYTFKVLSYLMDNYRGKIDAEKNLLKYAAYVAFFPTMVSGPIDRAISTIPQITESKNFRFENVKHGLWLMLWGYFQKVVIADRLALMVNEVFNNQEIYVHSGVIGIVASVFYSFQIYCDFSGYSDIAIGAAQVLGFTVSENFRRPYFAKSIVDFWKRWHISLTTWFRDYLYIPLGGNRVSKIRHFLNIMIVFIVSGLWHGAGWNFIFWGFLHGSFQIIEKILTPIFQTKIHNMKTYGTFGFKTAQTLFTFCLVNFAWIFFRSESLEHAFTFIRGIFRFNPSLLFNANLFTFGMDRTNFEITIFSLLILFVVNWLQRDQSSLREKIDNQPLWFRWMLIIGCIFFILVYGIYGPSYDVNQFIYSGF